MRICSRCVFCIRKLHTHDMLGKPLHGIVAVERQRENVAESGCASFVVELERDASRPLGVHSNYIIDQKQRVLKSTPTLVRWLHRGYLAGVDEGIDTRSRLYLNARYTTPRVCVGTGFSRHVRAQARSLRGLCAHSQLSEDATHGSRLAFSGVRFITCSRKKSHVLIPLLA